MSDSNELKPVPKYIEVITTPHERPAIEGELKALEFRAPWVSIMLTNGELYHMPVAQVYAIRITDQKEK